MTKNMKVFLMIWKTCSTRLGFQKGGCFAPALFYIVKILTVLYYKVKGESRWILV